MTQRLSTQQLATGLSIVTADGTIDLNDHTGYAIGADSRNQTQLSYSQIKATSPALAGEYLIHSTPQMVTESVQVYIYGLTQTSVQTRYKALMAAFEHWSYQLAWSWGDYSEHWNCNAVASVNANFGQGMLHNYMGLVTLSVPRFPTVLVP